MKKKAAVIGFLLGAGAGTFLVISTAFMGMLGHDSDPLLGALHMSPLMFVAVIFGNNAYGYFFGLGVQVLGFWGLLGALSTQGHLRWARRLFAGLLFAHYVLVLASQSSIINYKIGSLGIVRYVPYVGVMAVLLTTMILTSPLKGYIRAGGKISIAAGLILLAGLGVAGQRAYRHMYPFQIQMLDLQTGEVTTMTAAGDTYLCGIDDANKAFTTYDFAMSKLTRSFPYKLRVRTISYDGELLQEFSGEQKGAYFYSSHTTFDSPYFVETGQFADGSQPSCISVFKPGEKPVKIELDHADVRNLFWVSKDTLLAVTTPDATHRANPGEYPGNDYDASICLVDVSSNKIKVFLDGIVFKMSAAAVSPDGRRLAFVEMKNECPLLTLLDLQNAEVRELNALDSNPVALEVRWSPDSNRIAWAYSGTRTRSATLEWYDLTSSETGQIPAAITQPGLGGTVSFCAPDKLAWLDAREDNVVVVDLNDGSTRKFPVPPVTSAIFSIDGGRKLLLASYQ